MWEQVILASQSPRRRQLLGELGLDFTVIPARGAEHSDADTPADYVMDLARSKAAEVADTIMQSEDKARIVMRTADLEPVNAEQTGELLVIGADTVVVRGSEILGKPKDEEDAYRMLHELQGATHQVYTGVSLLVLEPDGGRTERHFVEKTDVTFGPMNEYEIRSYIATGDPMDKAGAYGIQSGAARYIKGINGDYSNVVGLPVARLYQELKRLERDLSEREMAGNWTVAMAEEPAGGRTVNSREDAFESRTEKRTEKGLKHEERPVESAVSVETRAIVAGVDARAEHPLPGDQEKEERLDQQFAFLKELDMEKFIGRQTYLTGAARKENDAEHAWHMAVMAMILSEYSNEEIDLLRTICMILLHDVVEIDSGDTYAYDPEGKKTQEAREKKAADRIFALLPADQAPKIRGLWDEFEAWETPEAKFAHACDNFQPLMLNRVTHGISWVENGIHLSQVIGRNARSAEGSAELWQYAYEHFIAPSLKEGVLKDDVHGELSGRP